MNTHPEDTPLDTALALVSQATRRAYSEIELRCKAEQARDEALSTLATLENRQHLQERLKGATRAGRVMEREVIFDELRAAAKTASPELHDVIYLLATRVRDGGKDRE